jgi:poly(3-hydroxybutyrate) depolymerase
MRPLHWLRAAAITTIVCLPQGLGAAPSNGCGNPGWDGGIHTLEHGGVTRTFRLHLPKNYSSTSPAPLVAIFHGWGGNEDEFLGYKSVRREADSRGYILIAPRGLGSGDPDHSNNSWSFRGSTTGNGPEGAVCDASLTPDYSYASCAAIKENTCSWTHCQADDVDFTAALIAAATDNLCVDTARVFATGGSNGGMFTWERGQNPQTAGLLRAIAPVIGLPHRGFLDAQGKWGDLPVLLITGTRDTTVPPGDWEDTSYTTTSNGNDRYYYTGATAITRSWAAAHGCDTSADAAGYDTGYRKADCRTYCGSDPDWPRVLDCRANMGHSYGLSWAWPLTLDFFDAQ